MRGKIFAAVVFILLLSAASIATAQRVYVSVPENVEKGEEFRVIVYAEDVEKLSGFDLFIAFNQKVLKYESFSLSPELSKFGINYDKKKGNVVEIAALTMSPATDAVSGDVELLEITFRAVDKGISKITFESGSKLIRYANGKVEDYPNVAFTGASVTVGSEESETPVTTTEKTPGVKTTATTTPTTPTTTSTASTPSTPSAQPATTIAVTTPAKTKTATTTAAVEEKKGGIQGKSPGFEIALGILALSLGIILGRRKF